MPLVPLKLPPGFYRNGTRYQAKGRYSGGNLVRWDSFGNLVALNAWTRVKNLATSLDLPAFIASTNRPIRALFSWRRQSGAIYTACGTLEELYVMDFNNVATNRTPVNLISDGPPVGANPNPEEIELTWRFAAFGETLLALYVPYGTIYKWNVGDANATLVGTAPKGVTDFIFTDQEIVLSISETNQLRRINWSDRRDYEDWTSTDNNFAGGVNLPGSGKLQRVLKVGSNILIISETDAYLGTYVGTPYVYEFVKIAEGCGTPVPQSAVAFNDYAVWFGGERFWLFDGARVVPLDCEVLDYFRSTMPSSILFRHPDAEKMVASTNYKYNEIWWFYKSGFLSTVSQKLDKYLVYNWKDNYWYTGDLNRTAMLDAGPRQDVLMFDEDGLAWDHEVPGFVRTATSGGAAPVDGIYADTGPLEVEHGDTSIYVREVLDDSIGSVPSGYKLTFYERSSALDTTPITRGPYTINNPVTPVRAGGRDLSMRFTFEPQSPRIGELRLDVAPLRTGRR